MAGRVAESSTETDAPGRPSPTPGATTSHIPELAGVVHRNIQAVLAVRKEFESRKTREERIADAVTRFIGSMLFVYVQGAVVLLWIVLNVQIVPGLRPFDPYPFVMLAMVASVEAIFLSTFVLVSQNRLAALANKRADLDLQINLLSEHEITRLIALVDAIAQHTGAKRAAGTPPIEDLKQDVAPEAVLQAIEEMENGEQAGPDDELDK
jgi:uncharacterized membrane protein